MQTDLWIALTPLSDDQAARRYRIVTLIIGIADACGYAVEGDPDVRLKNTMDLLQGTRYQTTNSLDILNKTIELAERTLDQMPPNFPPQQGLSMDLARWLVYRYNKTGRTQDLRSAI